MHSISEFKKGRFSAKCSSVTNSIVMVIHCNLQWGGGQWNENCIDEKLPKLQNFLLIVSQSLKYIVSSQLVEIQTQSA